MESAIQQHRATVTGRHAGRWLSPSVVVVAPTYNHGSALSGVLRSLEGSGLPIIVVDDGAIDETAAVLASWLAAQPDEASRRVITHRCNRGKAAALRTGFEEAVRLGYTHAATIDTDGQHDSADLLRVVNVARKRIGALVIGARAIDEVPPPWASRVGRTISNCLVWLESGVRVTDSQSGMRVYPLGEMECLSGSAGRYGFETEVLTRAGWRGVEVIETPIRCVYDVPGGRTTHFRVVQDSLSAAAMHARLIALGLMPAHERIADGNATPGTGSVPRRLGMWFSPRRVWRMARGNEESREQLAASLGVGLLMATLPLYGVKTAVCLWLSGRFRLHPLVVIGTSSLSTPPVGFVFVMLSVCAGNLLLRGAWPSLSAGDFALGEVGKTLATMLWEWIVGSVIVGIALAMFGYWAARVTLASLSAQDVRSGLSTPSTLVQSVEPEERRC